MNTIRNWLDRIPVDNKLLGAGITYVLTSIVVGGFGLDLDDELMVDPSVTVGQAIAFAAAAIVGYRTPNEATLLRQPPESGNAIGPV